MIQDVSPYTNCYAIDTEDGDLYVERRTFKRIPSDESIVHSVKEGETLQNIAFQYYGNSGYWGIIGDANNIYDAFNDIPAGTELIIPTNGGY